MENKADWMRIYLGTADQAEAVKQIRKQRGQLSTMLRDDGKWHAEDSDDDTFYGDGDTEAEAIVNAEYHAYWEGWCDANEWA